MNRIGGKPVAHSTLHRRRRVAALARLRQQGSWRPECATADNKSATTKAQQDFHNGVGQRIRRPTQEKRGGISV